MNLKLCFIVLVAGINFNNVLAADAPPSKPIIERTLKFSKPYRLKVEIPHFVDFDDKDGNGIEFCAPKDVKFKTSSIEEKSGERRVVGRFASQEKLDKGFEVSSDTCKASKVSINRQYTILENVLARYETRSRQFSFGALAVPFKFYVGGDKSIRTSSTVAPYIGYDVETKHNIVITPVFSSGLGLVPITSRSTEESSTRTALSVSLGVVFTSSLSNTFNAGLLVGRDFLDHKQDDIDPVANKFWFSLFVGAVIGG